MEIFINGMTSAELVNALNTNFDEIFPENIFITDLMSGEELTEALNDNFTKSDIYIGIRGINLINRLSGYFAEHDTSLNEPDNLAVNWINDFARITFNDNTGGQASHEIWEAQTWVNTTGDVVEDYVLRETSNEGIETIDLKTWQNSTLDYRIRAVKDNKFSPYTDKITINSPQLVFRVDQSTLSRVTVTRMLSRTAVDGEGTNNINWGDGSDNDYTCEDENVIFHDYLTEGIYWITITGDPIKTFEFYDQPLDGTDVTYWQLPAKGWTCHLYNDGLVGNITNWHPPYNMAGLHLETNSIESSCVDWLVSGNYTIFYDCHLSYHYINANNAGDLKTKLPKMAHFYLKVIGNISDFVFPKNDGYASWILSINSDQFYGDISNLCLGNYQYLHSISIYNNKNIEGDLSGWFVNGDYEGACYIKIFNTGITKPPRGNFYRFNTYWVYDNNINSVEIDFILADIETNVTANVPLYDCTYDFTGVDMGIPSAVGLASKTSIEGKYTAAGKTATILVNS